MGARVINEWLDYFVFTQSTIHSISIYVDYGCQTIFLLFAFAYSIMETLQDNLLYSQKFDIITNVYSCNDGLYNTILEE